MRGEKKKVCPLFMGAQNNEVTVYCIEHDCAWWSHQNECAIKHISTSLCEIDKKYDWHLNHRDKS